MIIHNCLIKEVRCDPVITPKRQKKGYRLKKQTNKKAIISEQKQIISDGSA